MPFWVLAGLFWGQNHPSNDSLYVFIASLSFFPDFGGFSIALKNTFLDLIEKFII
jgi:hypothetical protein